MLTNEQTSSKDFLPAWSKYSLTSPSDNHRLKYGSSVLMGHHLIVLVAKFYVEEKDEKDSSDDDDDDNRVSYLTLIFAVDLRDNSIQESQSYQNLLSKKDALFKYSENQILIFGDGQIDSRQYLLTIQSFEPFKWSLGIVGVKGFEPSLKNYTTQISQGFLYVYGQPKKSDGNQLWNLNICDDDADLAWELCKTEGEAPGSIEGPKSFVIGDNLYIYGRKENDIFELNLDSMAWTRLEQEDDYLEDQEGAIYKDHLIILKDYDELCCWNTNSNTWSTFDIKEYKSSKWQTNLVVYGNLLLMIEKKGDGIYMATLNLQNFPLSIQGTPEEQFIRSLFMNEEEADIIFKLGDQTLPAHKTILTQKSRYFANLFNSGMLETRQQVIEIEDCKHDLFKEFLRFLYFGDEIKLNAHMAIELFRLADKYLQNDLTETCLDSLTENINSDNVYTILNFACLEGAENLKSWCMKFIEFNLDIKTISELLLYLDQQASQDFVEENTTLRNQALNFVIKNYSKLYDDKTHNFKFYEDFLIKNITIDTIGKIANFIGFHEAIKINLREAAFQFMNENFEQLKEKKIARNFANSVLLDFVSYQLDIQRKLKAQVKHPDNQTIEEAGEAKLKNALKRMEPAKKDGDNIEEKAHLKKTKKSPSQID